MSHPLTIILLTYNEQKNLPACLASLQGIKANVFVVDSFSTDRTLAILEEAGIAYVQHAFENYSRQRNWAQQNNPFNTEWVFHLDAGERITAELSQWFNQKFDPKHAVDGYMFSRRTMIFGSEVKYGGQYPNYHLRLFRANKGKCEDKMYDQHFKVAGYVQVVKDRVDIIDTVMDTWHDFTMGHSKWAVFEALEILANNEKGDEVKPRLFGNPIERKRWLKNNIFQKSPLFVRAFSFFIYRYIFRLGFLDGKTGLAFHFLQGCWFRFLIDSTILEINTKRKNTGMTLQEVAANDYGGKYKAIVEKNTVI